MTDGEGEAADGSGDEVTAATAAGGEAATATTKKTAAAAATGKKKSKRGKQLTQSARKRAKMREPEWAEPGEPGEQ